MNRFDAEEVKQEGVKNKKENQTLFKKLKKVNARQLDDWFHEAHDTAFEKINCLDCALCCKTTGPLFTDKDIERIGKTFKMKPSQFIEQYLRVDSDGDYVLQQTPCTFLQEDNTCFIYDIRPKACREFPHTDRKNMKQILNLTRKNTEVCPAVQNVVKQVSEKMNSKIGGAKKK